MSKARLYFILLTLFTFLNSFSQDEIRIYKTINDSIDLKIKLIQPTNSINRKVPCAIFLSGGGWQDFAWNQLDELAYSISDRGMLSVIVEYRTSKSHNSSPYDALADVKDVLKYLRDNSDTLHIDKNKIVAIGVSAGAHLSFSSYFVDSIGDKNYGKESKPNYIIGFSPVIRNDSIGYGYNRIGENYKWFSPFYNYLNTAAHLPPSLIISGIEDPLIKFEYLKEFYKKAIEKDDNLSLYKVVGVGHSMKKTYKSIYTQSFPIIISFLEDNEIIVNSEIIKQFEFENNKVRNIIVVLVLITILFVVYFIKKKKNT